ncbi:MAG: hypothetical protein KF773_09415 [Deltaproteobacteria bacterium]|nr:hypothetical protein [Deltaproteobacteria bacterium]
MRLALVLIVAACGAEAVPTDTQAVCPSPDPRTFGYTLADTPGCTGTPAQCNFGKTFMDTYCINCHSSALPRSQRNGAPLYHDFDTFLGVMQVANHIDQQTGFGPNARNAFMPDGQNGRCPSVAGGPLDVDCPEPTAEERTDLAVWLACERDRPHQF